MKEKFRKVLKAVLLSMAFAMLLPSVSGISGQNGLGTVEAASPKLNKKKATIKFNKTVKLKVSSATKTVKWSSSNTSVAVVQKTSGKKSQTAVIKGTGKGTATITAKVGTKKLKAKIKVNHTHSYTYPATCTTPARCACGQTYGTALGHQMSAATCQKPATCTRCGATSGSTVSHSYSNNYCIWCGLLNLNSVLKFTPVVTSADGNYNMRYVGVYVENTGTSSLVVQGGTTKSYIYPNDTSSAVTLYLTDEYDNALISTTIYPTAAGTSSGVIWFDTLDANSTFTFMPTGRLEFTAQYGEKTYKIVLSIDGSFTFTQIS